jgi:MFS family permease
MAAVHRARSIGPVVGVVTVSDRLSVAARRAATGWGTAPVLALLCTAQFMVVLDTSIVNVALPAIAQDLGIPPAMLSWVVTGYTVALGGLLLLGGRAGDLFGERRMLLGGCVVFAAASLVGGLAVSGWMLIVARMSQGIGAAALTPAVLALITSTFRDEQARNRALGV